MAISTLSAAVVLLWIGLRIETNTYQGINYEVRELRIPLYLKISGFMDRHWNYKWLTGRILEGRSSEKDRVQAVFEWTMNRIGKQPPQLNIVDDHVWNIIVRGYGTEDQAADVFSTLCNYAGVKAFILNCEAAPGLNPGRIWLSAVHIEDAWRLCDPYRRILFVNLKGDWADLDEILAGHFTVRILKESQKGERLPEYGRYFASLKPREFDELYKKSRASIQDPLSRFVHYLRNRN